jgi:hypothetical protein
VVMDPANPAEPCTRLVFALGDPGVVARLVAGGSGAVRPIAAWGDGGGPLQQG